MYREPNSWPALQRAGLLLSALCMALVPAVSGAAPEAYGVHFVRLQQLLPGQVVASEEPLPSISSQGPAPYLAKMEVLELRDGPYADSLAEPLASLGRTHRLEGNYGEALSAYRRALHIVRVNDGLYSERQIPLLRELLLMFRETGDFESLDDRYEYFFRLYGMGQPPYTELRMRAAMEYLRWQREALLLGLEGNEKRRMFKLVELNDDLLTRVMADPTLPYAWKRDLAQSQLANLYLTLDRFEPTVAESQIVPSRDPFGAKPMVAELEDQRLDNLLRGASPKGRAVLEDLRPAAAAEGPVESAALELALADWNHWNGNSPRAREGYSRAISELQGAGETELLQQWFGEPVELPANGAFLVPEPSTADDGAQVRAVFDVSARGRARVRSAEPLSEATDRKLSGFRRKLGGTLFRPRWEGGEPRDSVGVQRDYRLLN